MALVLVVLLSATVLSQVQAPDVLLKQAMQREQVDGDLPGALALYKDIVDKFPKDPAAPRALLQMAGIYEHQRDRAAAQAALTRIVTEYRRPAEVVVSAKGRLAASSDGRPVPRRVLDADWVAPQDISANGRFAVGRDRAGYNTLSVVLRDLSTGQSRTLATGGGASVSDDGKYVAFVSGRSLGMVSTAVGASPEIIPAPEGAFLRLADWAPDGNAVLVSISRRADASTGRLASVELAWLSRSGHTLRSVRTFEPWQGPVDNEDEARVSPDGRFIIFAAAPRSGSSDRFVYVMDAEGRTLEPVVTTAGLRRFPTWAPDGKHVLFTEDRSGRTGLWSVVVENGRAGGEPRLLYPDLSGNLLGITTAGTLYYRRSSSLGNSEYAGNYAHIVRRDHSPADRPVTFTGCCASWSRDGAMLALIVEGRLVVREVSSNEERSYELPGAVVESPGWLHDASGLIVVVQSKPGRETAGFYRVDLASGAATRVLDVGPSRSSNVALSPDGRTLYLATRHRSGPFTGIAAVDLATGAEQPVASFPAGTQQFGPPAIAVSPDGATLAVAVSTNLDETERLIFTVAVDGSNLREVTRPFPGAWQSLRWTPDGTALVFPAFDERRNWRIMRLPAEGGTASFDGLSFDTLAPLVPDIRMNPGNFSGLDVSPDGTRIIVSTQTMAKFEVWTLDHLSWDR